MDYQHIVMRLEMIPRVDTDTDAAYAEASSSPASSSPLSLEPAAPLEFLSLLNSLRELPATPLALAQLTDAIDYPVAADGAPGSSRGAAIRGAGVRQIGREATKAVDEGQRNCIASISSQSSRLGRAQATLAFGDEVSIAWN